MPPTIRDFRGQGNAQQREQDQRRAQHLQAIKAAKVEAQRLTGDPKWDHFLQRCQANLDFVAARMDELEKAIPLMFQDEAIRQAQIVYADLLGQRKALTGIMSMPKDIMDNFERLQQEMTDTVLVNTEAIAHA